MALKTAPLREEHKELYPYIDSLREAAESVQENHFPPAVRIKIEAAYEFLAHQLIPHAQAEDLALYPIVQKVMGSKDATATMSRDHVEIGRLTEELGRYLVEIEAQEITREEANALRRILFGLYALVRVHFAAEEEVFLPLLDKHLKVDEAEAMFRAMETAAHEIKSEIHHEKEERPPT